MGEGCDQPHQSNQFNSSSRLFGPLFIRSEQNPNLVLDCDLMLVCERIWRTHGKVDYMLLVHVCVNIQFRQEEDWGTDSQDV